MHRISKTTEVRCNFLFINPRKLSVTRTCIEWPLAYETEHKTFKIMATKINYEVIDQFFSAQMSMNESEETVKALIVERGLGKNWTGTLEYHGFKIVVSRPKSYTWEQNTQLDDPSLDYYKQLHKYYEQLQENVKEARADLKRSAEKLANAHPDSESIKRGFRMAFIA